LVLLPELPEFLLGYVGDVGGQILGEHLGKNPEVHDRGLQLIKFLPRKGGFRVEKPRVVTVGYSGMPVKVSGHVRECGVFIAFHVSPWL